MSEKKNETKKDQPKIDFKAELKKAKDQIETLKKQNVELEIENQKNISDFQNKAKTFQDKAQVEVNKVKEEIKAHNEELTNDIKRYGSQKLIENLIAPLNNLELAIKAGKDSTDPGVSAYVTGFSMLYDQIISAIELNGVERIIPSVGDVFNPEIHESVEGNGQTIESVKANGYKLHERVLEPAKVKTK